MKPSEHDRLSMSPSIMTNGCERGASALLVVFSWSIPTSIRIKVAEATTNTSHRLCRLLNDMEEIHCPFRKNHFPVVQQKSAESDYHRVSLTGSPDVVF